MEPAPPRKGARGGAFVSRAGGGCPPFVGLENAGGGVNSLLALKREEKVMKIAILDGFMLNPGDLNWSEVESMGETRLYDRTPPDRIAETIGDADIVLTNKVPLNGETLRACPGVKYICVTATGYNIVDIAAADALGVTVSNAPGYSTRSVAQMTFALLLEACCHVGMHDAAVKAGKWSKSEDFSFWLTPLTSLEDKTLGIIGFGSIGKAVAGLGQAFGMDVLVYTRTPRPGLETDTLRFTGLDELLSRSDVVSLHCPLTDATRNILNRESISGMKNGTVIVNTARGQLAEDQAMAEALRSGKIGYYCADVASVEPLPADSPLLSAPNTILTPHIAWAAKESRARLMGIVEENLRTYLAGAPVNVVNHPRSGIR